MPGFVVAIAMSAAAPAAQDGPWRVSGDRAALPAAKLSLPMRAGGLALVRTGESTGKGSGLDDYAQFETADRKVFATAYIYRTTYPDAALAAYGTDGAITARFAPARLASRTVVPLAGRPAAAIRLIYESGRLEGAPTATAAAFARVGDWVLKLRASGPADRAAEVAGAIDALLAGTRVDDGVAVPTAQPLSFDPPCPPATKKAARVVKDKDSLANSMFAGLVDAVPTGPAQGPARFPANGATRVCVRGAIGPGPQGLELLQPAGEAEPSRAIAVLNDAGAVLSIEPALMGEGYVVKTYVVGAVETRGTLDRLPGAEQVAGWFGEPDGDAFRMRSRTTVAENGDTQLSVDPTTLD